MSLIILAFASCKKPVSPDAGSWVIHSTTYKATQAYYVLGGLVAYTGTGFPTGSLTVWFRDTVGKDLDSLLHTSWPPRFPSYTLTTSFPPDTGQAYIQLTDSSLYNSYHITGSTTPTITVTFNHDSSLVTVTIPPVMMVNKNTTPNPYNVVPYPYVGKLTGTDSAMLTLTTIKQTIR